MENTGSKRLAVLVGFNYANTPNELHGCINDVLAMRQVLIDRFGFEPSNIQLLTDAPGSLIMPTGAKIKEVLHHMVDVAEPGDILYFHYSGHGTRIPSNKHVHPFHQDEAIVPCDYNLITDVDFRNLVNRVPKGASFTILSDSCHSGGLIDKEKEQIGPSSLPPNPSPTTSTIKPKTISLDSILHHLSPRTHINTSDISTHLLNLFGPDASLGFSLPSRELDSIPLIHEDDGILLSGCQANETSADMNPHEPGGKAYGAFSNAVQIVLQENPDDLSNKEVVLMARDVLHKQGFQQHPCLYSSDDHANSMFLKQI
ncbi:putative Caspase-like domain superfamily [Helianthus annuus]|uniref:Caspase-like domain superfamily n=1 Tax=Helianthus annuus TaxID=4232 RepID=A0A251TA70_HELAN|nr:metacaspase-9 [Helianthus annuus]KAF5759495.1 putative Caspase-like domain superfamily [Helianthus annuus]KAJ0437693.1 putative Caspase-like domain superfamily [Helianthus annuus]KAJ0460012.1 putative Caspase-like domain superfamily [Helianthus annuus]